MLQVREEFYFTKGRIIVRGKLVARGKAKKAGFVLYYKPNIPIALIEAHHSVGDPLGRRTACSSSFASRPAGEVA
jgi:type I restriction enzyme, R subunit